jgi:folate-binding protein YgfZ
MTDRFIALLADRGLIELRGPDAAQFLQGLVTNDVEKIAPGGAAFAGLLTPKGKIVVDFLICCPDAGTFWIDAPLAGVGDLVKRFGLYKLRAKVEIADLSGRYAVGAAWGGHSPGNEAGELDAAAFVFADPRHAPLGRRFIVERTAAFAARLVAVNDQGGSEAAYHRHRIALAVPQGGLDYAFGEAFPHEACYDALHGVDFRKGCYVGQEVVSRMHHKGVAKTRIVGVAGSAPLGQAGSGAEIEAGGKPVGQIGSSDGAIGIALVRLDRLDEAVAAGVPLRAGGIELRTRRPAWANYQVAGAGEVRA